jgi:hypothetical protein
MAARRQLLSLHSTLCLTFRLLLSVLLIIQPLTSPRLATAQPLQAALDQIEASLNATINNARNGGLELELVLGAQIASQIALARQQFKTELDNQRQQWSAEAARLVDNLTQSVTQLTNHALAQAQDLINQGQLIALSVPFADDTPRIRAFSPVVSFRPRPGVQDLVYWVAGVFPDFGRDSKYTPTLTLDTKDANGKALPPIPATSGTALSVVFHVPSQSIVFPNSALRTIQAQVNIRYRKRCALLFHCDSVVNYPELIGILPQSPGNLHISFSVSSEHYVSQLTTSYVMHQDAGGGDDLDHPQSIAPTPGYEVLPDSVQIHVLGAGGDWGLNGNCSTATAACWRIKTVQHHCAWFVCPQGNDGSVNFQLTFYERMLTTQTQNGNADIPIEWNQTSLHTFPSDGALSWTATYTDFNNNPVPFGSSNTTVNSPYLKATNISDTTYGFSVFPFNTDASSELSIAIPQGAYNKDAPLNLSLVTDGRSNLNPLTPYGMSALKAFGAAALAKDIPSTVPGTPSPSVKISNLVSDVSATVFDTGTPSPSTPQEERIRALNALAAAAANASIGFK